MLGSAGVPAASRDTPAGLWSSWPRHDEQWIDFRWLAGAVVDHVQVY